MPNRSMLGYYLGEMVLKSETAPRTLSLHVKKSTERSCAVQGANTRWFDNIVLQEGKSSTIWSYVFVEHLSECHGIDEDGSLPATTLQFKDQGFFSKEQERLIGFYAH
jgi:hypothetical protein